MPFSNYTELQSAVTDWLNRPDLATVVPDFIRLAEARILREPAVQQEVRTTLTVVSDFVSLPADCREPRALYFDDSANREVIEIELVPVELLPRKKAEFGLPSGRPRFAAVVDNGTGLLFAPVPDQTYTVQLTYWRRFDPLATTATNALLTTHPDVYLFGALIEAEPYLKHDERLPLWQSRYDRALAEVRSQNERRRFSANTLVLRPRRPIG